jgi:hypothetical protein
MSRSSDIAEAREQERREAFSGTPIVGLLARLGGNFSRLFRQEIALARAEVTEKVTQLGMGIGLLVASGIVGFCGLLCLLASATIALSKIVDAWIAALAVGVVIIIVGAFLGWIGASRLMSGNLVPLRTVRSLKDNAALAKERLH